MKTLAQLIVLVAVLPGSVDLSIVKGQTSNLPPEVSIVWPANDCQSSYIFGPFTDIKIKANASDPPDGSIAQVQFFADTNLIGTVSNAPFSVVWRPVPLGSTPELKAVAVDNLGASTESASVRIVVLMGFSTDPVLGISSPTDGVVFAFPASFDFTAELLASPYGQTGPVEFFVGTNSVGTVTQSGLFTATTPLYSLTVTNVPEGDYLLSVKKDGYFANLASCHGPRIRVTRLGMNSARLTTDGRFAFDVVTSFPTNQNIIEASSNLLNWMPISTNVPLTNSFTFTEPSPATNSPRFYRAVVPTP